MSLSFSTSAYKHEEEGKDRVEKKDVLLQEQLGGHSVEDRQIL